MAEIAEVFRNMQPMRLAGDVVPFPGNSQYDENLRVSKAIDAARKGRDPRPLAPVIPLTPRG
jgi:hypothetical protein